MDELHTFEVTITGRYSFTTQQLSDFYGTRDPQEAARIDCVSMTDDVGAALSAMDDSEVTVKVVS
jgi:hypothetical protein